MRRRCNRLMGGGRTVLWDSFTGPEGTEFPLHGPASGQVYANPVTLSAVEGQRAVIESNKLVARNIVATTISYASTHRGRRNGKTSADIVRTAAGTNCNLGILARHSLNRGYAALFIGNSAIWQVFRRHPNTGNVQLGSNVSQALTQDQVYQMSLEVYGPVILLRVDGTVVLRTEDSYVLRGMGGIRLGNVVASAFPFTLDNWMCSR